MGLSLAVPVIVGLTSAVLVSYLADELPRMRRLSWPECDNCGAVYPMSSYISGQACRNCAKPRGLRFWLVMVGQLALSVFIWLQPNRIGFLPGIVLLTYFAVVVVIDMEHRLILWPTSVFGGLLAIGIGWWLHGPIPTALGGLAGFAIMTAFYYLGVLFTRIRAHRLEATGQAVDDEEALGSGDVTLATILGLLLGWPLIW